MKALENCREPIEDYGDHMLQMTDDDNADKRAESSTQRYLQDIRWMDDWLDAAGLDVFEVRKPHAAKVGKALDEQYSGTTPRYRWDRISAMYDWFFRMEYISENPFKKWDSVEDFGLTKSTNRESKGEEEYACTEEDIRAMEKAVTRHRIRDQLCIRLLWQTGMRRGEASWITEDMIDRDEREITIPGDITKNSKERVVAYQSNLDHLLEDWLDNGMRDAMLGIIRDDDGNIINDDEDFVETVLVGERGARLRGERINEIVKEAAINAGINERVFRDANASEDDDEEEYNRWKITAHNIRHGYGSYLVHETDAGLWEVSQQMGHSSIKITESIYIKDNPRAGIEHTHKYGPE